MGSFLDESLIQMYVHQTHGHLEHVKGHEGKGT